MNLYILRHGQAEHLTTIDEARRLTEKGRSDTQHVLQNCVKKMQPLDQLWASPLVRAQQTAAIAAPFFPHLQVHTSDLLTPEASLTALLDWLTRSTRTSVMLVSHQPLVGRLVDELCGKPPGYYAMDTSSFAAISLFKVGIGMGDLQWLEHA